MTSLREDLYTWLLTIIDTMSTRASGSRLTRGHLWEVGVSECQGAFTCHVYVHTSRWGGNNWRTCGRLWPVHPRPSPASPLIERVYHLYPTCATHDTPSRYTCTVNSLLHFSDAKTGQLTGLLAGKQGWKCSVALLATCCGSKSLKVILIDPDFRAYPVLNPLVTL
jgi:hypothetical protein